MTDKSREARARRILAKHGLTVHKDRARTWNVDHHGGYMVIDANLNAIIAGERYDLTLDDMYQWAHDLAGDDLVELLAET